MNVETIAGNPTIIVQGQENTSFRITAVPANEKWPLNGEPGIRIVAVLTVDGRRKVRQGPTIPQSCLDDFEKAFAMAKGMISPQPN